MRTDIARIVDPVAVFVVPDRGDARLDDARAVRAVTTTTTDEVEIQPSARSEHREGKLPSHAKSIVNETQSGSSCASWAPGGIGQPQSSPNALIVRGHTPSGMCVTMMPYWRRAAARVGARHRLRLRSSICSGD